MDDAHLLDATSATLLNYLVVRGVAGVVVTIRSGEPVPDAVSSVWTDHGLRRLEIPPLGRQGVGQLLERALGGPVEAATVDRLWSVTLGNALWLRHLVDGEVRAHRLRSVGGVWRLTGDPIVSADLTDLVETTMGLVSPEVGDVLDLLAIGEPVSVESLAALTVPGAIESAEQQGLVSIRGGPVL